MASSYIAQSRGREGANIQLGVRRESVRAQVLPTSYRLQANIAYNAGMPGIQYTIRRVSPTLDAELRREASETGQTLNTVVVQTLENAKLSSTASEHDDLDWFIGRLPVDAGDEAGAQAWLDALPVEPTA